MEDELNFFQWKTTSIVSNEKGPKPIKIKTIINTKLMQYNTILMYVSTFTISSCQLAEVIRAEAQTCK